MSGRVAKGRVLIVAGSDSSGGAGLQADIKTVTVLGGFAMTAVTAVTVQNTLGVFGIHEVPAPVVIGQIRAALEDIGVDALKTGMLHSAEVIQGVAATLEELDISVPLVVDPVMVAKGGASLLEDDAIKALKTHLIPRAAVVTPNIPEAEALTGMVIKTSDDQAKAGEKIMAMGAKAVLVKGGHMAGDQVVDVLVSSAGPPEKFSSPRINTVHTHGTGCTLASAIATMLAQGRPLSLAVVRAHDYVYEAIRTAPGFGQGHGPLNHVHTLPDELGLRDE